MTPEGFVDLHIHTIRSDGVFTPREVVDRAYRLGFAGIGIADHDTVEGIREVSGYAADLGLELIPAVELSSEWRGLDLHILGYYLTIEDPDLDTFLKRVQARRLLRVQEMIDRLQGQGVNLSLSQVQEIAKGGTMGRPHIAQALVEQGYVPTYEEAFVRFIGYHCPAYVPKLEISPAEAIGLIHRASGLAVLAHPGTYDGEWVIDALIGEGLDGLEAWHPEHSSHQSQRFLDLARSQGLLVTGGSDCHGGRKGRVLLGEVKLPYRLLAELKARAGR